MDFRAFVRKKENSTPSGETCNPITLSSPMPFLSLRASGPASKQALMPFSSGGRQSRLLRRSCHFSPLCEFRLLYVRGTLRFTNFARSYSRCVRSVVHSKKGKVTVARGRAGVRTVAEKIYRADLFLHL